jgi:histidyl-tRNA synthetase
LDYYSHTVFEFTCENLGAQNTLLAGGRYDGLVELMGGKPTAGIGWAAGIERLHAVMDYTDEAFALDIAKQPVVAVLPMGDALLYPALQVAQVLRHAAIATELNPKGNMQKRMKWANRIGAAIVLILGEDEWARESIQIKQMDTGEQREVLLNDMVAVIRELL